MNVSWVLLFNAIYFIECALPGIFFGWGGGGGVMHSVSIGGFN